MEIHYLLQLARKWIWLILLAGFIGGAAGLTVDLLQPKVYQAEATLFVNSPNHSDINTLLGNQQAAKALASFPNSDAVLRATLQVMNDKSLTLPKLSQVVSIQNDRDTQFVTIRVKDSDPRRAALLATEIAKQSIAQFETMISDPGRNILGQDLQQQVTQLATEIKSTEVEIQNQYQQLATIESQPLADPTAQKARVDQQSARIDRLFGTLGGLRSAYSQLYSEQIGYYDNVNSIQVTLLQDAQIPQKSSRIEKSIAITMGALAGLIAIVGVIIFLEQTDDILRTPEKIVEATALPILMHIAYLPTATKSLVLLSAPSGNLNNIPKLDVPSAKAKPVTGDQSDKWVVPSGHDPADGEIDTVKLTQMTLKQSTALLENISNGRKKVRYQLREEFLTLGVFLNTQPEQFAADGRVASPLLITSPEEGEGKTLVAAQIALSLARLGVKVVLVDGNLRNPQLHTLFGLSNRVGLSTLLSGSKIYITADDALKQTDEPHLAILTAGPEISSPAEVLASPELTAIIDQLAKDAFVVIDSPAVLTASEAVIMASKSEQALLVVTTRQTASSKLKRSIEMLTWTNVNVLGLVLNQASKEPQINKNSKVH